MKRLVILVAMAVTVIVMTTPAFAGTDNFHRGFHEGLGHIAADAAVGAGVELVGGVINAIFGQPAVTTRGQSTHPPPCPYPDRRMYGGYGYGQLGPREEAYNKEMRRLERRAEQKWVRSEKVDGKQQARNDFYGR